MDIVVHSGFGVETATKLELKRLGIEAPAQNGRFCFDGDAKDVVNLNLHLRTADRVSVRLIEFAATSFDELYDGLVSVDWKSYVPKCASILVTAKSHDSKLFALSAIQSVTKKAIINTLTKGARWDESGAPFKIEVAVLNDIVTVLMDTSGDGLHKRGYRDLVYEAPIKETLAAAIIELSVWNKDRPLIDPFCGSGTIPIESAMRALNIPAGYNRKFVFEGYDFIDKGLLAKAREEARDNMRLDEKLHIYGYDINRQAIKLAHHHAENAGLSDYIHFEVSDMRDVKSSRQYGVIITNPPYGERLLTEKELVVLYKDLGKMFFALPDWCLYLITAYENFEQCFGRAADKTRKLFNAKLPCRLYQFLGQAPPKKTESKN